jgi:hypothetical protein
MELFPHSHETEELLAKTLHELSRERTLLSVLTIHSLLFFRAGYDSDVEFARNKLSSGQVATRKSLAEHFTKCIA